MTEHQMMKEAIYWLKIACKDNETISNDNAVGKALYLLERVITLYD